MVVGNEKFWFKPVERVWQVRRLPGYPRGPGTPAAFIMMRWNQENQESGIRSLNLKRGKGEMTWPAKKPATALDRSFPVEPVQSKYNLFFYRSKLCRSHLICPWQLPIGKVMMSLSKSHNGTFYTSGKKTNIIRIGTKLTNGTYLTNWHSYLCIYNDILSL